MNILILTNSNELNLAIARYIGFLLAEFQPNSYLFDFENANELSREVFDVVSLWIIEAFHLSGRLNPVGWRTARKCGRRVLVLFTSLPEEVPDQGKFWVKIPCQNLDRILRETIKNPPPCFQDFNEIEDKYPLLKYEPLKHHHHNIR